MTTHRRNDDQPYDGEDPDGFDSRDEIVGFLERYVQKFDVSVRGGVAVRSLEPRNGSGFLLETSAGSIGAGSVVLATGAYQRPYKPLDGVPTDLLQLVGSYEKPAAIPDGPVLIVGSGQSGCQIAEELGLFGRDVYLACRGRRRQSRRGRVGSTHVVAVRDSGRSVLPAWAKRDTTVVWASSSGMSPERLTAPERFLHRSVERRPSSSPSTCTYERGMNMNPNKALWEKGDFARIAESMRESGETLVGTLGITDGLQVLDLGCGDGTTALPAARLGADVLGVDIASNLVQAGNARAQSLGLANCRFQEGDASDLSELEDDSFDLVVSIFGAMFAPRPFDVAKEMVRVTRAGGRIVMGNWIPGDPTLVAQILKISSSYSPPPPEGFVSPMTWGVEANVIERFAAAGVPEEKVSFERDTYTFNLPGPPSELLARFRTYYGPTMNAFDAAAANGREADLQDELDALFNSQNASPSEDVTSIPATFLRVTVAV